MRLHSSTSTQSLFSASSTAVSNDEFLCGYEEFDSSGTDLFTSWVKMSDREILDQQMVDIEKATAEFREASERKHATSAHMNSSRKRFATRSIVQRRLSIYNWNSWTPSGKRRCLRTTNCRKVAYHYFARGVPSMLTTSFSRIAST